MKEYVIKQGQYYLKENINNPSSAYRVLDIEHATEYSSLESAISYVTDDLKLNVANVSFIELETITTQYELVQCAGCGKLHRKQDLLPRVVNIETQVELWCEDCESGLDYLVTLQAQDLMKAYELNELTEVE